MQRLKDIGWGLVGNLAANFIQLLLTVLVATGAINVAATLGVITGQISYVTATRILGGALIIVCVGASIWYKNHRRYMLQQLINFGRMMYVADKTVIRLATDANRKIHAEDLLAEINVLLRDMCEILEYRIATHRKGATFLVLRDSSATCGFDRVAHVRHDHPSEAAAVLTRNRGLAGKALSTGEVQVLKDSTRAGLTRGEWVPVSNLGKYKGRAAAPVTLTMPDGRMQEIGVVCFDIQVAKALPPNEREIMAMIADKIGRLWALRMQLLALPDEAGQSVNRPVPAGSPIPPSGKSQQSRKPGSGGYQRGQKRRGR